MPKPFLPEHLNRQIPPEAHSAMYVWHKYWSRKTWNVVGKFIEAYSREGEIVFDPFAGSGVVAIEAVKVNRPVIICDLNPAATLITELTIRPVDLLALQKAFERVQDKVQDRILALYEIHCVKCGQPVIGIAFVRTGDELVEVRYPKCPHCGFRAEGDKPVQKDKRSLEKLEQEPIREWFTQNRLYYDECTHLKNK
jgi:putative DNA methylase